MLHAVLTQAPTDQISLFLAAHLLAHFLSFEWKWACPCIAWKSTHPLVCLTPSNTTAHWRRCLESFQFVCSFQMAQFAQWKLVCPCIAWKWTHPQFFEDSLQVEVDLPVYRTDVNPPTKLLCSSPCAGASPSGGGFAHASHGSGYTHYILVSTSPSRCLPFRVLKSRIGCTSCSDFGSLSSGSGLAHASHGSECTH